MQQGKRRLNKYLFKMRVTDSNITVIFGASGDLTRRKLIPALYELQLQKLLPSNYTILGVGRTKLDNEQFRQRMKEGLREHSEKYNKNLLTDSFLKRLFYLSIETSKATEYNILKNKLSDLDKAYNTGGNYLFYLATPPGLYEIITRNLFHARLTSVNESGWKRLIVEKPFGYNLKSASSLNKSLLKYFSEGQIYRIDHYLGKETVQNVMVTRFSNGIFEPLWNRNYVHHVEITAAESIGIGNRGRYYDSTGALRDMVQNHLLQIVALVAMEPPTVINSASVRNEILKVFQSLRHINIEEVENSVIRGQYTESVIKGQKIRSYRDEPDVSDDSRTETFVALKLFIDNWRWGGIPFYIRTGKRLPTMVTEVVIHFKPTPHKLFCFNEMEFNSDNQLVIRIQPDEGMLLKFGVKMPGTGFKVQDVNMDFHYSDLANNYIPEAYQRLLMDCMQGDSTLYARGDAIEEAWKFIDPILDAWNEKPKIQVYGYPAGTWGPHTADSLIEEKNMTWRYPCKNLTDNSNYCEL
jgi:glucose-6-phosphate 1-dehydrogenase